MDNEPQLDHSPLNDLPVDVPANGDAHDERSLITAHALGELNADESAETESRLRDSTDDAQLVGELARLGRLLRKIAAESPLPQPAAELRAAVLAELTAPPVDERLRLRERIPRRRFWLPLSLAASLAIVCGTLVTLTKTKHAQRTVAHTNFIIATSGDAEEPTDGPVSVSDMDESERLPGVADERLEEAKAKHLPSGDVELRFSAASQAAPNQAKHPTQPGETDNDSPLSNSMYELEPVSGPSEQAQLRQVATEDGRRDGLQAGAGVAGGGQRANQGAAAGGDAGQANGGMTGGMAGGVRVAGRGLPDPRLLSSTKHRRQFAFAPQVAPGDTMGGGSAPRSYRALARSAGELPVRADLAELELAVTAKQVEAQGRPESLMREHRSNEQLATAPNAESYSPLIENPFQKPTEYPLSTFSIDVDTASYTNVRRFLNARSLPPSDAVRIEELINYFQYAYPQPEGDRPFSVTTDVADCPWNVEHRLLRVGLKGREVTAEARPAGNLVFLLDVSGSMQAPNKLPLVKEAMNLLTEKLTENDHVAIVTYAGNSGLALPPTNGTDKAAIHAAIAQLAAGGSTNGGQGLQMAYDTAQSQFIKRGVNRVILATDGDFNVGVVNQDDLVNLVAERAKSGVYLTALGFGMGNLKDGTLEKLADKGNGNYSYIDTLAEARRVLVEQLTGTLVTIAKDVKLRIEFNPAAAASYRLIGYENRIMPPQDFHDDRKDAGEIGAGHTVTALYEIVPAAGAAAESGQALKYQPARPRSAAVKAGELATIQLRYKDPDATESRLIEQVVTDRRPQGAASNADFQFAAAVAEFGMLLRSSAYGGAASYKSVLTLAEQGLSDDSRGYRSQFIELVRQARDLSGKE